MRYGHLLTASPIEGPPDNNGHDEKHPRVCKERKCSDQKRYGNVGEGAHWMYTRCEQKHRECRSKHYQGEEGRTRSEQAGLQWRGRTGAIQ
jgi:hypothetical protein